MIIYAHRTELTFVIRRSFIFRQRKATHCSSGISNNLSNFIFHYVREVGHAALYMMCVCNPLRNPDQRISHARCVAGRLELPAGSAVIRTYRASLLPDYCWLSRGDQGHCHLQNKHVRLFHLLTLRRLKENEGMDYQISLVSTGPGAREIRGSVGKSLWMKWVVSVTMELS